MARLLWCWKHVVHSDTRLHSHIPAEAEENRENYVSGPALKTEIGAHGFPNEKQYWKSLHYIHLSQSVQWDGKITNDDHVRIWYCDMMPESRNSEAKADVHF
jgi:hypothetical protein